MRKISEKLLYVVILLLFLSSCGNGALDIDDSSKGDEMKYIPVSINMISSRGWSVNRFEIEAVNDATVLTATTSSSSATMYFFPATWDISIIARDENGVGLYKGELSVAVSESTGSITIPVLQEIGGASFSVINSSGYSVLSGDAGFIEKIVVTAKKNGFTDIVKEAQSFETVLSFIDMVAGDWTFDVECMAKSINADYSIIAGSWTTYLKKTVTKTIVAGKIENWTSEVLASDSIVKLPPIKLSLGSGSSVDIGDPIALSCNTVGAAIKYKIGSDVTMDYTAPIAVSGTAGSSFTLSVWAEKSGLISSVKTQATYNITLNGIIVHAKGYTHIHAWLIVGGSSVNFFDKPWPGEEMLSDFLDWKKWTFNDLDTVNLIFSNNGSSQTSNLSRTTGEWWYKDGVWHESNPEAIAPVVSATPGPSSFSENISVALSVSPSVTIYYTIDDSTPSEVSSVYSTPLTFTETTTLKTYVTKDGLSEVKSFTYTKLGPQPPVVTATPSPRNFTESISVTLTVTPEVNIYYTIDGTAPTAASTLYNGGALVFIDTTTIKTYVEDENGSSVKAFTYTKQAEGNYYKTNPNGQVGLYKTGITVTCVNTKSDGFTDWSDDLLIAQGVANDDSRAFKGGHEYPVYDTYSLYAAWDDANLYLGWQFVYVNDIVDPSNNGGNEAKPTNGDIPQMLVFDLDPAKSSVGGLASGADLWAAGPFKKFDVSLGVDTIAMFSSKGGVGVPSMFFMNEATGFFEYATPTDTTYAKNFTTLGIVYGAIDGLLPASVWGINKSSWDSEYTPETLLGNEGFVDMIPLGHTKSYDTFYEMKIPFTALGITKTYLETNGIGVMHVSTFGESSIASIPFDMTTVDKAEMDYSKDPSSTHEKEDLDTFTTPLARIGKL